MFHSLRQYGTKASRRSPIGFIGLGNMGLPMAVNLAKTEIPVLGFDIEQVQMNKFEECATSASTRKSIKEVAQQAQTVITVLPNDRIVKTLVTDVIKEWGQNDGLHIGCSTVSPETSRELSELHRSYGQNYVCAPIFARPDGMAAMQANFVVSGECTQSVAKAIEILKLTAARIECFGSDPGAANVVKLCGNFLIASAIEAMAEACALAEANGVDRVDAIKFYSSTFLNSVIYQGYGQRVSERDHRPGGFALDWGLKDVSLVQQTAHLTHTPMPFLSVLVDRFLSEKAKGRGHLDWSAIALGASEDCGKDVTTSLHTAESDV